MRPTYHLVPRQRWMAHDPLAPYAPDSLRDEGFIHCTDGVDELLATANRYYRLDPRPYLALTLDLDAVGAPWRVEDPAGIYPHVHGPIAPEAILACRDVARSGDGTFTAIGATWDADPAPAIDAPASPERLVRAGWLEQVLAGERPGSAPARAPLLFHVNSGRRDEYDDGHIPGAHYLDTDWLEDPADWDRRASRELDRALCALGIASEVPVILYGRDPEVLAAGERWDGPRGQLAATRALLILHHAGVQDVRLLDGGYHAWVQGGRPVDRTDRPPDPVRAFGRPIPARPDVLVDIDAAREIVADPAGSVLVDVRTWREHVGAESGYDYIGPAGRIRGDAWHGLGAEPGRLRPYRDADNTLRPFAEIATAWARAGITPDKRIAFYCGTGWRASEAWFVAFIQGWPRVAVYDGGWYDWSRDPSNPIASDAGSGGIEPPG